MSLWNSPDEPLQTIPPLPRSVFAFAAVAAGMMIAREGPVLPSACWFSLASGACALAVLVRGRWCKALLCGAAVCIGAGFYATRVQERPAGSLATLLDDSRPETLVSVEGLVLDEPRAPVPPGALARFASIQPRGSFTLDVSSVLTEQGWRPVSGTLRVGIPGTSWSLQTGLSGFPVRAGQGVRLSGVARPIEAPLNPGETDYRLYAAQDNLAGSLDVESSALAILLPDPDSPLARLRAGFYSAREKIRARARAVLDPGPSSDERARAFLLSLFLGAEESGQREVRRAFTHVGLAHVLAISGFHLTVMAYVALFLVRLTGDRGLVEPAIVGALIVLYLLAVPASAPVVRAGILSLALMGAEARARRYDALAVLGWTGVALILWRPLDLWGLGFQLSLGLTALLLWVGRYFHSRLFGPTIKGLVRRARPLHVSGAMLALEHIKTALSSSLLCWMTAAPLIAYRTGLVSPLAILTTLVVLPPILVFMGAGYVVLIAGIISPEAGPAAAGVLTSLASLNVALVDALDALPGSGVRVPPVGLLWVAAATGVLLFWFLKGYARHIGAWVASAVVVACLGAALWLEHRRESRAILRLDALAVGDGSCVIIRSAGQTLMWNCGSTRVGIGEHTVPDAARAIGGWRVPTVVMASPDLRRLAGILDIIEPLGVRRVIVFAHVLDEARDHPEGPAAFTLAQLRRMGIEIVEAPYDGPITVGLVSLSPHVLPVAEPGGRRDRGPSMAAFLTVAHPFVSALLAEDLDDRGLTWLRESHPKAVVAQVAVIPPKAATTVTPHPQVRIVSAGARPAMTPDPSLYVTGQDGAAWARFDSRGDLRTGCFRPSRTSDAPER